MMPKFDYLSISKRDADCYDICYKSGHGDPRPSGRVAALRSDFDSDPKTGDRTVIAGTWRIRWEHTDEAGIRVRDFPEEIAKLRFNTVHDAFAFYCGQVLV